MNNEKKIDIMLKAQIKYTEKILKERDKLQQRIDDTIEFCNRYLQLNLELFDSYKMLEKIKEILGDKEQTEYTLNTNNMNISYGGNNNEYCE